MFGFQALEVLCRGSETHLQVDENKNSINLRGDRLYTTESVIELKYVWEGGMAHWQSAWLPRQSYMRPGFYPRWSCVGFSEKKPRYFFLNVTGRSR